MGKNHKRLIINEIVKRFSVKKGIYTEGYKLDNDSTVQSQHFVTNEEILANRFK